MKKYVMRLSASGVLCLSVIGCGSGEIQNTSSLPESDNPVTNVKGSPVNCDSIPEQVDLSEYLADLQQKGRLVDCDVELQYVDQTQVSLPPDL